MGLVPTSSSGIPAGGAVSTVTAGDTSIVIGGTAAAVTVETNTLDVIAADHPPAASWSNNSHKITSVATATTAGDALPYGQAAGEGLAGTYPNPYVVDLTAVALGCQFQTGHPGFYSTGTAPNTGDIFGCLIGLPAGAVLTGIKMRNQTAAAGTSPTLVRFGLSTAAGVMVAVSANLNTTAFTSTEVVTAPFTSQYTVPTTGGYHAMFIAVGTWGNTQPAPVEAPGLVNAVGADGANPPAVWQQTGQSDLPAVNSSVTFGAGARFYYFGLY